MAVVDASYAFPTARRGAGAWLRSPAWDLTFVSLSAVLVVVPYSVYRLLTGWGIDEASSAAAIDLLVTLLVGGPHMYATFTRTVADADFRLSHQRLMATSVLVPLGVVALGLWAFPVLLTLFLLWASVHVLHQITFLIECYNRRRPRNPSIVERAIDYAVVVTSPYPLALERLFNGTFSISGVTLVVPDALRQEWIVGLAYGAFALSLALFALKTAREVARGAAQWPKLLLITVTAAVAFLLPSADRLDAAFQGFNAWHSFQYLGLTWYANRLAAERGQATSSLARHISGPSDGWRFYGVLVLCTVGAGALLGLLMLLRGPLGLAAQQPYYIVVLSFLLIHYYHDHVLFTQPEALVAAEQAAPAPR